MRNLHEPLGEKLDEPLGEKRADEGGPTWW
jgi:hypothetical protein